MTKASLVKTLCRILHPPGDPEREWSPDTIETIDRIVLAERQAERRRARARRMVLRERSRRSAHA